MTRSLPTFFLFLEGAYLVRWLLLLEQIYRTFLQLFINKGAHVDISRASREEWVVDLKIMKKNGRVRLLASTGPTVATIHEWDVCP